MGGRVMLLFVGGASLVWGPVAITEVGDSCVERGGRGVVRYGEDCGTTVR